MSSNMLTTAEAGKLLGVSQKQINKWIDAGKIPAEKIFMTERKFIYRIRESDCTKPGKVKPGPKPKE